MTGTDPDQQATYAAEARLETALAAGGRLTAMGRVWELEADQQFATLASAQLFATLTCAEHSLPPVRVRHRNGDLRSHYEPGGVIALASWGGTRLTLCHELAHHAAHHHPEGHHDTAHGRLFRQALCDLLATTGAPQQAEFLRAAFNATNLPTGRPS